jgi:hypothetical protein
LPHSGRTRMALGSKGQLRQRKQGPRMGIKQPTLADLYRQALAGGDPAAEQARHGPRRAVIHCHHGARRYPIAEVWGNAVFGTFGPHDLRFASHVYARCRECPGEYQLSCEASSTSAMSLAVKGIAA